MSESPAENIRTSGVPVFGPQRDPGAALSALASRALEEGKSGTVVDPAVSEMRHNRRVNAQRKTGTGGANMSFATGRPIDPMFYWKQNNLPYALDKPEELKKVREYCSILYLTHPVVGSAIDVYAKYPLTGMEMAGKDEELNEFYSSLFFDQLNYEEFLVDAGKQYWIQGEAWPLGTWNDMLGIWEDDELLKPDDVEVIRSPFLKEPRFQIKLPEVIRKIINDRAPQWEFEQLIQAYPEFKNFVGDQARMPVSNILLKQIAYKPDTFHNRGLPIMLRGLRAVMQEEMLNAAQDAVASRLYTPLILAKLGASATDLGTQSPWVPTDDDIASFEESLDAALAADFRVLTTHFATNMSTVFGRETMPNFDADFDRLTDRLLQVFGLSRSMLSGAEAGTTYASDSINRDLVSQLLIGYQRKIQRFFRQRALVVAEAQQHYDYEVRGGRRYPIMEEVLEVDEGGNKHIVEKPKLLVPELRLKAMTLKDETDQRQFFEALRASGVPISMKSRLINVPLNLDEEIDLVRDEQVRLAVEAQETRKAVYQALRDKGLPIPEDLLKDFQGTVLQPPQAATPDGQQVLPNIGTQIVPDTALVPTPQEQALVVSQDQDAMGMPADGAVSGDTTPSNVVRLPRSKAPSSRPPESDEERATMPKPASLVGVGQDGKTYTQVWHEAVLGDDGKVSQDSRWDNVEVDEDQGRSNMLTGPLVVGSRRYANLRGPDGELLPLDQ